VQLAEEAGVSITTITGVETGRTQVRFNTLKKIADALETDARKLVHPEEELVGGPPKDDALSGIKTFLEESELRLHAMPDRDWDGFLGTLDLAEMAHTVRTLTKERNRAKEIFGSPSEIYTRWPLVGENRRFYKRELDKRYHRRLAGLMSRWSDLYPAEIEEDSDIRAAYKDAIEAM